MSRDLELGILTGGDVHLGYCHGCQRPCPVLPLKVAGWKHVINICSVCLDALKKRADAQ